MLEFWRHHCSILCGLLDERNAVETIMNKGCVKLLVLKQDIKKITIQIDELVEGFYRSLEEIVLFKWRFFEEIWIL